LASIRSFLAFSAAISLVVMGRFRELEPCVESREGDLALPSWEPGRFGNGKRCLVLADTCGPPVVAEAVVLR
jgi:hypothetical protein